MPTMFQLPCVNDHYGFEFGQRDELGRLHPGDDYNGPGVGDADEGTPVKPIGPGEVSYAMTGINSGWGNHVFVKHDMKAFFASHGIAKPDWCPDFVWSHYAHLKALNVKVGDAVTIDTVIGPMGKSGTTSRRSWTSHLHWEVRKRPLGVTYYPPKEVTVAQMHDMYFDPEEFVTMVNNWVTTQKKATQPSQNQALVDELKARVARDEEVIGKLVAALARIGKQTDVSDILKITPWVKV